MNPDAVICNDLLSEPCGRPHQNKVVAIALRSKEGYNHLAAHEVIFVEVVVIRRRGDLRVVPVVMMVRGRGEGKVKLHDTSAIILPYSTRNSYSPLIESPN